MNSIQQDTSNTARRLRLRVLIKTMLSVAALAIAFVILSFFFSGDDERPRLPSLAVDVQDMLPGDTRRVLWERRPVIIHRRTEAELAYLATAERSASAADTLEDPDSQRSEQPDLMRVAARSRRPEWFVAIALGTDQGCPVAAVEPAARQDPAVVEFIDECRGSRFDAAGRVYADQFADRNLAVPAHDFETVGGRLQLILGR